MTEALEFTLCRRCFKEFAKWVHPYCRFCWKKYYKHTGYVPTQDEINIYCKKKEGGEINMHSDEPTNEEAGQMENVNPTPENPVQDVEPVVPETPETPEGEGQVENSEEEGEGESHTSVEAVQDEPVRPSPSAPLKD